MSIALVVLNDIHFQHSTDSLPVLRIPSLVAAIASENVTLDGLIVLFAGDIANTGVWVDYQVAAQFINDLRAALELRYPTADIYWLAVPGNHDCVLPEDEADHRKSQVEASVKTLLSEQPDRVFVEHLLSPQRDYWEFSKVFDYAPTSAFGKLAGVRTLRFGNSSIQFNLLNSAVLSQRHEASGSLYVPVKLYEKQIPPPEKGLIAISVIHHPFQWFEPENMLALRHFLSRSSDIVITGHQHFHASFSQTYETGERVQYYESPALNDLSGERSSSFLVMSFDLNQSQSKTCAFEWADSLYRPKSQTHQWRPLELNRGVRPFFALTSEFTASVSDPGVIYLHPDRQRIALSDLFVYPDLKSSGSKSLGKAIKGPEVFKELSRSGLYVIKGDAFSGKTALSRSLFLKFFVDNERIPVLLDATRLIAPSIDVFEKRLLEAFKEQYENADVDAYKQLPPSQRVIIIDNWHYAKLSPEIRSATYIWLRLFASSSILFTDKLHEIKQIVKASDVNSVIPAEDSPVSQYEVIGLSHTGRGELINRWVNLRKDSRFDPPETTKESKNIEDTISRLLGKDHLPPYAFFVICLLQAKENRSIENIAGGSFGHLYEVLVVSALNQGGQNNPQIDRKYAFLSEIAAFMWRNQTDNLSLEQIRKIASSYLEQFAIELDVLALLRDLEAGRVLSRTEGSYSFSYAHFFYYFVARYIRDRIDEAEDTQLLESVDYMIDHISSEMNSTIIMFLIYFAKEKRRIISRIVNNANRIYAGGPTANFETDIGPFVNRTESPVAPEILEEEDIAARRAQQRNELDDGISEPQLTHDADHDQIYAYADDLPDSRKLHLADRSIEALGQIIRNFSATLPISTKKEVLGCAYRLGLRTLFRVMGLVASVFDHAEGFLNSDEAEKGLNMSSIARSETKQHLEVVKLITGKVVAIVLLKKISSSVGVADMEQAYEKAIREVEQSTATRLLEVTIEIEHFKDFPENKITLLSKDLRSNPFAKGVLQWIVASYLLVYRVERRTRQKMAQLLNVKASQLLTSAIDDRDGGNRGT